MFVRLLIVFSFSSSFLFCMTSSELSATVVFNGQNNMHRKNDADTIKKWISKIPTDSAKIDTLLKYLKVNWLFLETKELRPVISYALKFSDSLINNAPEKQRPAFKNRKAEVLIYMANMKARTGDQTQAISDLQRSVSYFNETKNERGLAFAYR